MTKIIQFKKPEPKKKQIGAFLRFIEAIKKLDK